MTPSTNTWTEHLRRTLLSYDEPLLRRVSNKLCKPRNHWPAQELIDRCLTTLTNAAVLDPNIKQRFADLGAVAVSPNSPDEFAKFIAENIDKWTKVIKFAGIKPQ